LKQRIEASSVGYLDPPYRRFVGTEFEQETLFVQDPNGNILEMKTMVNPEVLFSTP
jgi:extradiol dioxygenase family protein